MKLDRLVEFLRGGHAGVRVVTFEEPEVCTLLFEAGLEVGLGTWSWTAIDGLEDRSGPAPRPISGTEHPAAALVWLRQNLRAPALVVMRDLADHFTDPKVVRAARELIESFRISSAGRRIDDSRILAMVDARDDVPAIIAFLSVRYDVSAPDDAELERIVRRCVSFAKQTGPVQAVLKPDELRALVQNLRGLPRRHAAQLVEQALRDRELSADDLPGIMEGKRRLLAAAGVLEHVTAPASLDDIGGLERLKSWLRDRGRSFTDEAAGFGVTPPRGLMLLGVQGAGKSLAARAVATAWHRPLMLLDPGALYDRFIGESESRLRQALRQAEAMAPVVLWIDEIEKGFAGAAGQSADGGLSRRMFGSFLTWLQEKKAPVFVIATANDVSALPPELLRKGRFDEIFFVDLPGEAARRAIFAIHLRRRKRDPAAFDLGLLAAATEGFSGAEIEQAVVDALHRAFAGRVAIDTALIADQARRSPPLSVTMAERISDLRAWARGRCVPADEIADRSVSI